MSTDHPQGTGSPARASTASVGGFNSHSGVYVADERLVQVINEGEAEAASGAPLVTLDDVLARKPDADIRRRFATLGIASHDDEEPPIE